MIDQQIDIATKDGKTTTFITHPERGGPFPVIIFYMDAPAIREELRDMARRLGTSGYYVMLPNMYYRSGVMELGPIPPDPEAPERKRMFGFMNSINIPMVMEDTKALLAYAETQEAANTKIVGTVGYCMSGRYAVNAATHFPDRVKAAASIYGTHLATDQPDSPHLAASKTKAELYFACAETDIYAPQEIIDKVAAGMKGSNNEVEIYPGTHHGFAFPKRPVYHRDAAERHWERLLALYRRNLCRDRKIAMAEIRLRDYESADAENLNRIAVSAFDQFRDHYGDWPAMLAGLSKTSDLSASGEVIIAELQTAELQNKFAGAVAYFGPNSQKAAFFDQRWPIIRMLVVDPAFRGKGIGRALSDECIARAKTRRIADHCAPYQSDHVGRLADVSEDGVC